jgi:hypothetical protein
VQEDLKDIETNIWKEIDIKIELTWAEQLNQEIEAENLENVPTGINRKHWNNKRMY